MQGRFSLILDGYMLADSDFIFKNSEFRIPKSDFKYPCPTSITSQLAPI